MTLGIDIGAIKLVISHAAAVHGLAVSTEAVDMARLALKRLGLVGKGTERDRRPTEADLRRINAEFPAPQAEFETFITHLLHALSVMGPDHVGIGADWDGGGGVRGLEDVSDLPRITERLLAEGYSEEDLAAIWGGNALRLLRRAEDHAAGVRDGAVD